MRRAPLGQLDDVAEQHEPLGALERAQQRLEGAGAAQDVALEARAEVEIRDDEGPHRRDDVTWVSGASGGGR